MKVVYQIMRKERTKRLISFVNIIVADSCKFDKRYLALNVFLKALRAFLMLFYAIFSIYKKIKIHPLMQRTGGAVWILSHYLYCRERCREGRCSV